MAYKELFTILYKGYSLLNKNRGHALPPTTPLFFVDPSSEAARYAMGGLSDSVGLSTRGRTVSRPFMYPLSPFLRRMLAAARRESCVVLCAIAIFATYSTAIADVSNNHSHELGFMCTLSPDYGYCEPTPVFIDLNGNALYDLQNGDFRKAQLRLATRVANEVGGGCSSIRLGGYLTTNYSLKGCRNRTPDGGPFYVINARTKAVGSGYAFNMPPAAEKNTGQPKTCGGTNPINLATGDKFERVQLLPAGHQLPEGFAFTYNAQAAAGNRWRHTFSRYIEENSWFGLVNIGEPIDADSPPIVFSVRVFHDDGRATTFFNEVDWYARRTLEREWQAEPGGRGRLFSRYDTQGGLVGFALLSQAGVVEHYDLAGKLLSLQRPGRPQVRLEYSQDTGRLERVSTLLRQRFQLAHDAEGNPIALSDADGHVYQIKWTAGRLQSIVYPDQTPQNPSDNPSRTYLYEDDNDPGLLTGIIDENGVRAATWVYDDQGRAISSEHADATMNFSVDYQASGDVVVGSPLSHFRTYQFITQYGETKLAELVDAPCATCPVLSRIRTYDDQGFMSGLVDDRGRPTAYQYDAHGYELSRTEAAGTPEARTITTSWNIDFGRPLTVTEPGRRTVYTYDGQGRVLSSVVQSAP